MPWLLPKRGTFCRVFCIFDIFAAVESAMGAEIADNCLNRLHATQYPWEHDKWTKTFDHQA